MHRRRVITTAVKVAYGTPLVVASLPIATARAELISNPCGTCARVNPETSLCERVPNCDAEIQD